MPAGSVWWVLIIILALVALWYAFGRTAREHFRTTANGGPEAGGDGPAIVPAPPKTGIPPEAATAAPDPGEDVTRVDRPTE